MLKNKISKSEDLIIRAFVKMLKETSFESIKVVELCEKAQVTKVTFYNHFKTKKELLNVLMAYLENGTIEIFKEIFKSKNIEHPTVKDLINAVLDIYFKNEDLIISILKNDAEHTLYKELNVLTLNSIKNAFEYFEIIDKNQVPVELVASFYSGGISNMLYTMSKGETKISQETKRDYINTYINKK